MREAERRSDVSGPRPWASSSVVRDENGMRALERALEETSDPSVPTDLTLLFASPSYGADLPRIVRHAYRESGASVLVGCSGQGVIGTGREVEGQPALSLLRLAMPGTALESARFTQQGLESGARFGADGTRPNGWLVFADPYHLHCEALLDRIQRDYPGTTVVGGLASGDHRQRVTHLFLNGEVHQDGAVGVGLCGQARLQSVVSQGCRPIGEPWTVTAARTNLLERIGGRPAYEVLVETVHALPPDVRRRVRGNLLLGVAMDEYRDQFGRGDYLVRNLIGADQEKGILAVGTHLQVGQTVQFQLRDGEAAGEDLDELLAQAERDTAPRSPLAALLCACNGRGTGLFGAPDHDARAVEERFGPIPVAGFFCNGEIGPVGGKLFLHGYTASIAILTV